MMSLCSPNEFLCKYIISIASLLLIVSSLCFADDLKRIGFIGVKVVPIPDGMRRQLSLPEKQGILVEEVIAGGSAEAAGTLPKDIILKVNDITITDPAGFVSLARRSRAGDKLQLSLIREGKPLTKDVLVKPRPFENNPDFGILYSSVVVDGTKRRVIVTRPKAAGKYPAIFLVNGLGCFSQDNLPPEGAFARILYTLTRNGFVTMRVEKSGMGDSEGLPCTSPQVDLQAEVRGYIAGLKALKAYDYVDSDKVFIFGISMGGTVGPMVANEVPVKGLIVAETVGKSWFEYLLENSRRQLLLKGKSYDEVERIVHQQEFCYHRLYIEKQTREQIVRDVPACAQVPYPNTDAPLTYLQQVMNLNLAVVWKNIDTPVLVIYGTADYVTSEEEHQYLTKMINSFHPGNATFVRIENMDHSLERVSSQRESMDRNKQGQEQGEFNPILLTQMQMWLDGVLKKEKKG